MGLTKNMIQLILSSKEKRKVSLDTMIMIGRQHLHLGPTQLADCFSKFGYDAEKAEDILTVNSGFADGLFEMIGAKKVDSLDASDYEDATIIQDLNEPLPNEHKAKYDLVLDSGTLEHVFNFPVAIKSCLELTKVGGHYIGIYPCNNFFGHGFYQFSSELFYRVFSKDNGFEIIDVVIFVDEPNTGFYSVPDTSVEFQRIQFTNSKPVYIYVVAKKIEETSLFKHHPLQMDYSQIKWKGFRADPKHIKKKPLLKDKMPPYLKNLAKAILNKKPKDDSANFKKSFLSVYQLTKS